MESEQCCGNALGKHVLGKHGNVLGKHVLGKHGRGDAMIGAPTTPMARCACQNFRCFRTSFATPSFRTLVALRTFVAPAELKCLESKWQRREI